MNEDNVRIIVISVLINLPIIILVGLFLDLRGLRRTLSTTDDDHQKTKFTNNIKKITMFLAIAFVFAIISWGGVAIDTIDEIDIFKEPEPTPDPTIFTTIYRDPLRVEICTGIASFNGASGELNVSFTNSNLSQNFRLPVEINSEYECVGIYNPFEFGVFDELEDMNLANDQFHYRTQDYYACLREEVPIYSYDGQGCSTFNISGESIYYREGIISPNDVNFARNYYFISDLIEYEIIADFDRLFMNGAVSVEYFTSPTDAIGTCELSLNDTSTNCRLVP